MDAEGVKLEDFPREILVQPLFLAQASGEFGPMDCRWSR